MSGIITSDFHFFRSSLLLLVACVAGNSSEILKVKLQMEHYQLINKELSLEVQKLRLHLKEYDKMCAELRNENRELQAQNAIMKSYISQNFENFSSFSNKFSNEYVQLCARGIKISLPPPGSSNRNSIASSHRSSLRNSVPLSSPRRSASPNRYRSSPEVFYQRSKRLPYSGNTYRAQVSEAKQNLGSPENANDDSYQEDDDDERCEGGFTINYIEINS